MEANGEETRAGTRVAWEQLVEPGMVVKEPELAKNAQGSNIVKFVLWARTCGYSRKPDAEDGVRGIQKRPGEATVAERYAVKCYLNEATTPQIVAGIYEGGYTLKNLLEWLHVREENPGRRRLNPILNRLARGESPA